MARILVAWEMGDSLGHLANFSSIAHKLIARGHELFFALNDTTCLELFSFSDNITFLPAPYAKGQWSPEEVVVCNASILLKRGYGNFSQLKALVRCWHGLFRLVSPDIYLFDYAPTAMLAARGSGKPKVTISSGFGSLVPGEPDIDLAPWHNNSPAILARHEALVVATINRVCAHYKYDLVNYLSDIYRSDLSLMSCLPELDEYHRDSNTTIYFSVGNGADVFPEPQWSENGGTKTFAYLKAHLPQSKIVLDLLADNNLDAICYCAGLDPVSAEKYRRRGVGIHLEPVSLGRVLSEAQIVICHAGKGLVSQSLRSGVPLLLLPGQIEQYHTAIIVEKLGAGLRVPKEAKKGGIQSRLEELELDPVYRQAARLLANRNLAQDTERELAVISDCLERLLEV
jgi:hypothetical protein